MPSELANWWTDCQTVMSKLLVTFRNVACAPNKIISVQYYKSYILLCFTTLQDSMAEVEGK